MPTVSQVYARHAASIRTALAQDPGVAPPGGTNVGWVNISQPITVVINQPIKGKTMVNDRRTRSTG